ncbi:MAG TPA: cytochrome c biogenesis protein CcsA [Baekduia sp.]|uniref:cytochrome c biogenesis protein n=1 Tax=Baekduia sp. TaxID=2600305 RepID=UPI002B9B1F36|nr:cytochrome c biogenesis protein CcsA [Baekduia sp.]HMJ33860.1 cytochrome c biogenesis protein CcsA [Baekduia sp.]
MYGSRLRSLSAATVVTLITGYCLAAFVAPMDADQGFMQKIFYLHVPMAIVALGGFVFGGICAIMHLRTDDAKWDLRSYVAIHISVILGVGVLLTGAIWAKASWGHWWVWDEPTLVSFLIVFLLYATYTPLRFSIEDREKQARYASVFAITAGAFVPLNFLAVRAATSLVHPRTFDSADNLPGAMRTAFLVCFLGMVLLYVLLWRYEMAHKNTVAQLRSLKRKLAGDDGLRSRRSAAPELQV